jgi:hypothetical protein
MPKTLGNEVLNLTLIRSITGFGVTVGSQPGTDFIDVAPVVERRDAGTNDLVEVVPMGPARFSEEEIRDVIASVEELPDYDKLRVGLSKLMHALLDTR